MIVVLNREAVVLEEAVAPQWLPRRFAAAVVVMEGQYTLANAASGKRTEWMAAGRASSWDRWGGLVSGAHSTEKGRVQISQRGHVLKAPTEGT